MKGVLLNIKPHTNFYKRREKMRGMIGAEKNTLICKTFFVVKKEGVFSTDIYLKTVDFSNEIQTYKINIGTLSKCLLSEFKYFFREHSGGITLKCRCCRKHSYFLFYFTRNKLNIYVDIEPVRLLSI